MKFLSLALVVLAVAAFPVHAGTNAGGAMIVHTSNSYTWSSQTVCTTASGDPGTCESATTLATKDGGQVVWLLAAFTEGASPAVSVVYFGIDYSPGLDPGVNYRACGPSGTLEVPDNGWPYTGRGNAVAFGTPILGDRLFPFYAFRIDGGAAGSYFGTAVNPTGGYAAFVDDNISDPFIDLCTRFGTIRWHTAGSNNCPVEAMGACCFDDGSCVVLFFDACVDRDGVFQGLETACDPNPCPAPQVCCNFQTQECRFLPPSRCQDLGEFWEAVNPEDAGDCDEAPCDAGACCRGDGTCEIRQRYDCSRIGGAFQGAGSGCDPNPCPGMGACCFPDGTCLLMLQLHCELNGWLFQGEGTNCVPNPCPQPPQGACCFAAVCSFQTEQFCWNAGGVYLGDDLPCDPNPCGGACCVEGQVCFIQMQSMCLGTFLGNGTVCAPDPCPRACCRPDGGCSWLFRPACEEMGGTIIEDPAVVCDEDHPCASFVACCLPDGSCVRLTPEQCAAESGISQGPGTDCVPDPCAPPVPVESTTWGKIKSKYR